jgi:hypothetical protein
MFEVVRSGCSPVWMQTVVGIGVELSEFHSLSRAFCVGHRVGLTWVEEGFVFYQPLAVSSNEGRTKLTLSTNIAF